RRCCSTARWRSWGSRRRSRADAGAAASWRCCAGGSRTRRRPAPAPSSSRPAPASPAGRRAATRTSSAPVSRRPTNARAGAMRDFLRAEAAGGLALLIGSVVALLWVNVVDAGSYASFWGTHVEIGIGDASIDESLGHWVNDGLMTFFFFLISLE